MSNKNKKVIEDTEHYIKVLQKMIKDERKTIKKKEISIINFKIFLKEERKQLRELKK